MHTMTRTTALLLIVAMLLIACGATPAEQPSTLPPSPPEATTSASAPTEAEPPSPEPATEAPSPAAPPTPEPPTPTLEPLVSNTIPENGEYIDSVPYTTTANDPGVGPNDGDGIASVTFRFIDPDGQEVYSHTERTPRYCAFGGGDNGQDCTPWVFADHGNTWPNGKPARSGSYKLLVTVRGVRGGTAQNERTMILKLSD